MTVRPNLLVRFTLLGLFVTVIIAAGSGWFLAQKMTTDAREQAARHSADAASLQVTIDAIKRLAWGGSAVAFGLLYAALLVLASGASRGMARQEEQLHSAFVGTVRALANAVDFKDTLTGAHSSHVAEYAVETARHLGLRRDTVEDIRMAAYLHDLGKIGISDTLLRKPGALAPDEVTEMRRHPIIAAQILDPVPLAPGVKLAVKHNHERWDGNGYPDGLRGEDIPIEARILGVADAFEAMITDHPYRRALGQATAVEELRRCAGSQFDPRVIEAFLQVLRTAGAGTTIARGTLPQADAGGAL